MIRTDVHEYGTGGDRFIGRLAWDDAAPAPRPGVLIAPAFGGLSDFEIERATDLAAEGYTVLAVDYYGDGKRAGGPEEASGWMQALNADRPELARRMICALETLKSLDQVDAARTGAFGYCFGGKCVLDLARTGAAFQAVASLHGVLDAPTEATADMIPATLILHGWDDPLATPQDVLALTEELTKKCPDWQMLAFGHTGHAFTNPAANRPKDGMAFSENANRRSWQALLTFLDEHLRG